MADRTMAARQRTRQLLSAHQCLYLAMLCTWAFKLAGNATSVRVSVEMALMRLALLLCDQRAMCAFAVQQLHLAKAMALDRCVKMHSTWRTPMPPKYRSGRQRLSHRRECLIEDAHVIREDVFSQQQFYIIKAMFGPSARPRPRLCPRLCPCPCPKASVLSRFFTVSPRHQQHVPCIHTCTRPALSAPVPRPLLLLLVRNLAHFPQPASRSIERIFEL